MAAVKHNATVVGVFEDRRHADEAVNELMKAGFRRDQIGVAMRHTEDVSGAIRADESAGSEAGTGALAGALTGLGLGALTGLGVLAGAIPVVGPAITAGTLGIILTNAAAGAGIVGVVGALIGAGIPENEAKYYNEEFEAGRTIVTVQTDGRADEATAIMRRHGAYDMSSRGTAATTTHTATRTTGATGHAGETMELKEERLRAEKHPVETGEVSVRKEVHTETKSIEVPVEREEVVIERTPTHGRPTAAGHVRGQEEIRIPVHEEQVNVTKEPVVTEEVRVGKRTVQDTEHVSGQVRKEEIKVERTGDVDVKGKTKGNPPV